MDGFDHNAGYIWAIVGLGLFIPAALAVYVVVRARMAKCRLNRLQQSEDEA